MYDFCIFKILKNIYTNELLDEEKQLENSIPKDIMESKAPYDTNEPTLSKNETFFLKDSINKDGTVYWLCKNRKCSSSVTTLDDFARFTNAHHNSHDEISNVEFACKAAEEKVVEREKIEEKSVYKINHYFIRGRLLLF
ncbi:unnamed protein product [Brachionus calyciflorus]|uniref:FLYWCH-type domain-containing protein n=1 Tax=Brachionus calyciflorus TaxID=104777 RepID=A0A813ZDP0_9BILA|nr:unnamed protein product [Brachionus calyciflorus]